MRFSIALAAAFLWATAAGAQTDPASTATTSSPPAASTDQAANPTTGAAANPNAVDRDHEIVCHTTVAAGSRLSRHATRVCKTRAAWEMQAEQTQLEVQQRAANMQTDLGHGPGGGPQP
jgi:hypothetical protein